MNNAEIQHIIERLNCVYERRQQILASGNIAPEGAWIHTYVIYRKFSDTFTGEYCYAKWQSKEAIFKRSSRPKKKRPLKAGKNPEYTNHQHIGRVWSNTGLGMETEVEEAYEAWENRLTLETIDKALSEIRQILDLVKPNQPQVSASN